MNLARSAGSFPRYGATFRGVLEPLQEQGKFALSGFAFAGARSSFEQDWQREQRTFRIRAE
jgi:hypothetical protein